MPAWNHERRLGNGWQPVFFVFFFSHIEARVEAGPEVEFYSMNTGLSYHLTSVKHGPTKTRMPLAHLHSAGRIWGAGGTQRRSEN